jgi:hypothetical protein
MNQNCISLGLHDSRVQALEQENERLREINGHWAQIGGNNEK